MRARRLRVDIHALCNAIDNYAIENAGVYPASLADLLETPEGRPAFIKGNRIPVDPWGAEYLYEPPVGDRNYRVSTLGRDGQEGGEGEDADVSNLDEDF